MSKLLPGDKLYRHSAPALVNTAEAQRNRVLAVLQAGFTQGTHPARALAAAAHAAVWLVRDLIHEGRIIERADGTLEAVPLPPKRVRLQGDTMFDGYDVYPPPVNDQLARRYRVLAVLRAGFTQGERPVFALSAAAKTSESIVRAMIGEGIIIENADGTLKAAPNVDHHPRVSAAAPTAGELAASDPFAPAVPYE